MSAIGFGAGSTWAALSTLAGLLVVCILLGRSLLRLAGGRGPGRSSRSYAVALDLAAGVLGLHLLLLLLYGLGIRWSLPSVASSLGLAVAAVYGLSRKVPIASGRVRETFRGWGDAIAALTVAIFAAAAWTLRATHPDFVYHWGIKAKKFLLAGGLDVVYLGRDWNHFLHPDYPTLIPELQAVTSLPAGSFSEPVSLLWSVVFFAGLLVALRETLARSLAGSWLRQPGLAFLALGLGAFAIGQRLAGGADLALAFAFAMALPVLLGEPSFPEAQDPAPDDLALGVAAAFAAASKIEGVVLAVSLIAVHLLRRLREGAFRERRLGVPALARIVLPSLLVVLPWLAIDLRHGLFQPANSGPFEIARWPGVVAALGEAVAVRPWHGMSVLILATPLLLVFARTRALAGVILVQLAFYLWVFFTQVGDPEVLVRTSFPRLLLPLLPAVIVGFLAVSASRSRAGP